MYSVIGILYTEAGGPMQSDRPGPCDFWRGKAFPGGIPMIRSVLLAAMVAAFLPLAGCFQSAVEPLVPPDRQAQLLGTWESELDGLTVTFAEDWRFLVQPADGGKAIKGNYRIDGAGIILANDPTADVCPSMPGSYTFVAREVSGVSFLVRNLRGRFMLVRDSCEARLAYMQEAYIKR
jgi:hypothetical protein